MDTRNDLPEWKRSVMISMISELGKAGVLINVKSHGSDLVQVVQHQTEADRVTVQNGTPLFTGTPEEAAAYIMGLSHGMGV